MCGIRIILAFGVSEYIIEGMKEILSFKDKLYLKSPTMPQVQRDKPRYQAAKSK